MKGFKWAVIAAALFIIFFIGRTCGINSVIQSVVNDTTITIDSSHNVYVPVPYKVDSFIYKKGDTIFYTVQKNGETVYIQADTTKLLEKYFSSLYYSDTQKVSRGTIVINDTISRNQITGRGLDINLRDTTITKTIVLKPPKRMIGYFGITTLSNKSNLGAGADFSLKLSSDHIFSIGTMFIHKEWMLQAGIKLPIRLKK